MKQNYKQKLPQIIKLGFTLILLFILFFGIDFLSAAKAASVTNCTISTYWADSNNNQLSGQTLTFPVGSTQYRAVAVYNNCQTLIPSLTIYGGSYGNTAGTNVGLGSGALNQASQLQSAGVTFSQDGQYYFVAAASYPNGFGNAGITAATSNPSLTVTASANGTPSGASASTANNGLHCAYDSDCGSNYCDQNPSDSTYGLCEPNPTSATAPVTAAPAAAVPPGATAPAAATVPANPTTALFNPLPESDLTHVFLLVTSGFLGILGIVAVLFIIVGGFQMVIASGSEEMYAKGKKTIAWAIIGLVVALLSFSIIAIVEDLLQVNIPPATTTTSGTPNSPSGGTPNSPSGGTPN